MIISFKKSFFICALAALMASSLWAKDKILSQSARKSSLEGAEKIFKSWKEVRESPFLTDETLFLKASSIAKKAKTVSKSIEPEKLNNLDILKAISAQLKPTGVVNFSGENFLLFSNGQKIKNNSELSIRVGGKIYQIRFDEITPTSFRLHLDSDSIVTRIKQTSTNSASFDNE